MANQLAETVDIAEATQAEMAAPAGLIEVRFYTAEPLSSADVQGIFDQLYANGVDVKKVYIKNTKGLPYVGIIYKKPAEVPGITALPLAIIPLIATGLIVAVIGIGIFKIQDISSSLTKVLLVLFGGTIILAVLLKKPLEAAAGKYIERI